MQLLTLFITAVLYIIAIGAIVYFAVRLALKKHDKEKMKNKKWNSC